MNVVGTFEYCFPSILPACYDSIICGEKGVCMGVNHNPTNLVGTIQ